MPKTTMTPDDMKAYLKAWDEVNAAHNALMTHLLEAGSDKECQEANRRLDAAIAKAQEFRPNSSSSTLRARLTASVMFSLETLDASALRGDSATPKLPYDTFASATLAPCGDTLFLRGLPSETKPALFPENESDCRFVPLLHYSLTPRKSPLLVFSSIPSL